MTTKKSKALEARLIHAKTFAQTWHDVAPDIQLDKVDVNGFTSKVETLEKSYFAAVSQETLLDETRSTAEAQADEAELIETNVRNSAKIRYGANSLQYGQLGGVRTSERKRPSRRNNNTSANSTSTPKPSE